MWSGVASLLHVMARSGVLWDGIGWFGRLGWSGVVWACFCLFLLGWSAVVWGWSGVVWDNMHSFLHVLDCLGGGHRWFGLFWGGLRWPGFVSARSKVVWDSQGSGAVWGGLAWSGLVSVCFRVVWGCLGWSGVVRLGSSLGSLEFVWGW